MSSEVRLQPKNGESWAVQDERSNEKIANLEKTIQELRIQLAGSQRAAKQAKDSLNESVRSLHLHIHSQETSSTGSLIQILCAHEQKHRCEVLYTEGRIIDAAVLLLETAGTISEDVKADKVIMDWLSEFTNQCITSLERIGDEASSIDKHDEALTAYSTALSLGPSIMNILLIKWASKMLLRHSANEVLGAAAKFKLPRFDAYRAICDALEGDDHVQDAIGCFQQMQRELMVDTSNHDERARWELGFQRRCTKKLGKFDDIAVDSHNYNETAEHFSTILSLDADDRMEILIKRSKAQASMKLWEDALSDADEAIKFDPSSHRGYEIKHAALHGAKRNAEAVEAFNMMLLKLEESPDERVHELRNRYVDAIPTIRHIVDQTISHMPRVLIDTTTGRLCDKRQQEEAFEALPIYSELVSSMTTEVDFARIWREVKEFYRYVMFSHTWEHDEPLLQKVEHITIYELEISPANTKLQSFCSLVHSLGFRWAWSDTCCVDKDNTAVLQESLVGMFTWYRGSSLTVIYLRGVSSQSQKPGDLRGSIWNTRAWTYQAYVAPETVQFYTEDWKPYLGLTLSNHKGSPAVISEMEQGSGIPSQELAVLSPGLDRVREKLYIASMRQTTIVEDFAYSLLGIFNAAIPIMYGEGNRAVGRLLEHILTGSGEVTILAWTGTAGTYNSCLPMDLTVYSQLVPLHVPRLIETAEVDRLRLSLTDLSLVMRLYDCLNNFPSPSMAASRLRLPGIVFRLTELIQASGPDSRTRLRVYHGTTPTFGDIEIKTVDNLLGTNVLYLVHPWIRPLLDQEFSHGVVELDKMTQALRLVARLRQAFGALLFKPLSRAECRRVAANSLITVQIREEAPLTDLIDNIQTIEVH